MSQGREQCIRRYRETSVIGLAAIGSPTAIKTLREMRDKANEGLRTVIQSALIRFQRKKKIVFAPVMGIRKVKPTGIF
jgi:hypothetical protein